MRFLISQRDFSLRCTRFLISKMDFSLRCTRFLISQRDFSLRCTRFLISQRDFSLRCTRFLISQRDFSLRCTRFLISQRNFSLFKGDREELNIYFTDCAKSTKMTKFRILLLVIIMQKIEAGTSSSCFFRLAEEVVYQPVPLEIPQERSITSCGLTCIKHPKCLFMAISGKTCVLMEDMRGNKYRESHEGEQKWSIYEKV